MKSISIIIEIVIRFLKCFFILLVFGQFLPKILDYILYNFIEKMNVYDNSILVYNILSRNKNILYNYIYIFNEFLKF